jgi:hypothetical protein
MQPEKVDERLLPKEGKTRTAVHDPELKRLRAIAMMRARIAGNSINRVAEMFQVSDATVERVLSYAKRAGLLVEHGDTILQRMVPLAESAIIDVLKDKEVDKVEKAKIALKLYEGTGLLGNKGAPAGVNSGDSELASAMRELREKAKLQEQTIEGQILEDAAQRLLTAGVDDQVAGADQEDAGEPAELPQGATTVGAGESPPHLSPSPPAEVGSADDPGGPAEPLLP